MRNEKESILQSIQESAINIEDMKDQSLVDSNSINCLKNR
jgi:hypothetical protein